MHTPCALFSVYINPMFVLAYVWAESIVCRARTDSTDVAVIIRRVQRMEKLALWENKGILILLKG